MAFPTTSIIDSFNRANEGPPPSSSWTTGIDGGTGGFTVTSNAAKVNNGTFSSAYWNLTTFGPDVEVYATISSVGALRLYWRITNIGASHDGYLLQWYTDNTFGVYRVDGGSLTQLGSSISQSAANGDAFGISHIGSTITVYYKASGGSWTSLGTRTDNTHSTAGYIGIAGFDSTSNALDDFGGGTIVSGPSPEMGGYPRPNKLRPRIFAPGLAR